MIGGARALTSLPTKIIGDPNIVKNIDIGNPQFLTGLSANDWEKFFAKFINLEIVYFFRSGTEDEPVKQMIEDLGTFNERRSRKGACIGKKNTWGSECVNPPQLQPFTANPFKQELWRSKSQAEHKDDVNMGEPIDQTGSRNWRPSIANSLIAKEGEKREHIMAKRTLKGQNVSTHFTSNLPLSIPTNKSRGLESPKVEQMAG